MKAVIRFLGICALLILFNFPAAGQEVFIGPKMGFTLHKAAFNFSKDEELFDQKVQLGYQVGGAFGMPLKDLFGFYAELYLSEKGKKTIIVENGLENQSKYYFVEAPILLRMSFEGGNAEAGKYKYHIDVGPTISYWLGGNGTVGVEGFEKYKIVFGNDSSTVDLSKQMLISNANRWQWGLNLGIGLEYPVIKNQSVFIDLRFVFGHSNLVQSGGTSNFGIFGYKDDLNVRMRQFQISAAYMFTYDWRLGLKGKSTIKKRKQF